ncbi:hypothetical protein OROMI_031966 [Orobanche minor]
MVFGKRSNTAPEPETEVPETQFPEDVINLEDENQSCQLQPTSIQKDPKKPLLEEVTYVGAANSKNAGGSKVWICKHCKEQFTSSYTRIHYHFFGAEPGAKAGIKRCPILIKDREKYQCLFKKVTQLESEGVSSRLQKSVISKNASSKKKIEESFGIMERNMVDMKILKGLFAKKVLSQPISSSSAERNWSTYSYIHNVKRNRLNSKRADKLVFIHSNVRLLSRFSESYKSGPHKKWDVNPESTYIEGSSARLEDMTWENLDDELVDNGKGKRPRVD